MKYNNLSLTKHATSKRLGRGIASGKGKTAGRGTKGQGARQGASRRPGFEGGQTPLMQHLPKLPGFASRRPKATNVYTGQLERFAGKTVDAETLATQGLIANPYVTIKVLAGHGDLTKKVTVKLPAASAGAIALIEKAGGSFEATPRLARPVTAKKAAKAKK
ncbi:MAG TPA: 50S ribosomal protein L15 [Candidatus Saccharimonadales bacterium]|nr:50S ribosomal protein L15 [Candidatus Saccharimonadales bacterium]